MTWSGMLTARWVLAVVTGKRLLDLRQEARSVQWLEDIAADTQRRGLLTIAGIGGHQQDAGRAFVQYPARRFQAVVVARHIDVHQNNVRAFPESHLHALRAAACRAHQAHTGALDDLLQLK